MSNRINMSSKQIRNRISSIERQSNGVNDANNIQQQEQDFKNVFTEPVIHQQLLNLYKGFQQPTVLLDLGFEETKIFVPSRIQENTEIQIKRVTKEA
jgi:hypothetical protein